MSKRHPLKLTLSGAAHAFVYPVNRAEVAVSGQQDASFTKLCYPHFRMPFPFFIIGVFTVIVFDANKGNIVLNTESGTIQLVASTSGEVGGDGDPGTEIEPSEKAGKL